MWASADRGNDRHTKDFACAHRTSPPYYLDEKIAQASVWSTCVPGYHVPVRRCREDSKLSTE